MNYGKVTGIITGGMGAGAIAVLPNTGGSRSVVRIVAMLSVAIGLAVLVSTAIRYLAKRRYNA